VDGTAGLFAVAAAREARPRVRGWHSRNNDADNVSIIPPARVWLARANEKPAAIAIPARFRKTRVHCKHNNIIFDSDHNTRARVDGKLYVVQHPARMTDLQGWPRARGWHVR